MRIAIVYSTVGGTTRECASLLARELKNQEVELFEIGKNEPYLSEFDSVVVGFPVMMGKGEKKARKYIVDHLNELYNMKAAYFICCGFIDCFEDYAENSIPDLLRESAVDVTCLGGSLDPQRFKGLKKLIVKSMRSEILGGGENGEQRSDISLPTIMDENISQLADKIKKSF